MPLKLTLDVGEIVRHYNSEKVHDPAGKYKELLQRDDPNSIAEGVKYVLRKNVPEGFEWHDIKAMQPADQQRLWATREWLFAQILIYVALTYKGRNDTVLQMFGSNLITSDIDVSVEGSRASEFIKAMEGAWERITGAPTIFWDIEFYGDFLMFMDHEGNNNFLNSRKFDLISGGRQEILAFVGVSILRNAGSLNFPMLNLFLADHPQLEDKGWKAKAESLFQAYRAMPQKNRQEQYYRLLNKAEVLRDSLHAPEQSEDQKNVKTFEIFVALCNANIYRSENYILPSTVIHVVRDIQAKAPKPSDRKRECPLFKSKLASCPMSVFTYLCSAMEQIGYMKRFDGDQKKQEKYGVRLQDAIKRIQEGQVGGKRRGSRRNRRKGRKTLRRKQRR